MAARGPAAGRDGLAVPRAGPASRPDLRAGVRRRHRCLRGRAARRDRSKQLADADHGQFLQACSAKRTREGPDPRLRHVDRRAEDRQRLGRLRSRRAAQPPPALSILVESAGERILVDCGPDLRQQLLAAEVGRLDGVIVTHDHGDHCHGIDDLRPIAQAIGGRCRSTPAATSCESCEHRFAYAFEPVGVLSGRSSRPRELAAELPLRRRAVLASSTSRMAAPHRSACASTKAVDRSAYAIDFSELTDEMAALYEGVDVWICDCLTRQPHPTHAHLDGVLGWARDLRVGQALSDPYGQRPRLSRRWSPNCPTGPRRPMTGWRSRCDDQRSHARRRLSADGDRCSCLER